MNVNVEQAAAAIVKLINAKPRTPTVAEIEAVIAKAVPPVMTASTLLPQVRQTVARLAEAERVAGELELISKADFDAASAEVDGLRAELRALEDQAAGAGDLVALAAIAKAGADVGFDGKMEELDLDDAFERAAARLIEAVLQLGPLSSLNAVVSE
jgi:hypothetical protein